MYGGGALAPRARRAQPRVASPSHGLSPIIDGAGVLSTGAGGRHALYRFTFAGVGVTQSIGPIE